MTRWTGPATRAAFTILFLAGTATAAPLVAQQQAPAQDQPAITQTAPASAPQAAPSVPASSESAAPSAGPRVRPPVETAHARFNTPDPIPMQDTSVNHSYLVYILVVAVLVVLLIVLLRRA